MNTTFTGRMVDRHDSPIILLGVGPKHDHNADHRIMNQVSPALSRAAPATTIERWLTGPRVAAIPSRAAATPAPAQLWTCIRRLEPLAPRFVSVTYGAGGTTQARTHATVTRIVRETSLIPAAHLTCVGASRGEVDDVAREYWDAGVRHIVALRGDAPPGEAWAPHPDGYTYAADLVEGLRRIGAFEISVAAYPEVHPTAASPQHDLDNLKRKLDAGATRAITNYFFEGDVFLRFLDRALAAGISAPIVPGIMPVTNYAQAKKFSAMCGASVPEWMGEMFAGTEDDAETRRMIAAIIVAEQVRLLQANGVDEFHFYTLNRADLTYAISHLLGVKPRSADKAGAAGTG